jgi:hypothetical protein
MKIEKVKSFDIDLSNLEKYIFNTIFVIILLYIFSVSYHRQILVSHGLSNAAMLFSYIMLAFLILSRILSYQYKSAFVFEQPYNLWAYYKGNRKISFEINEILSIKKSFWGLYSSFVIKIKDTKIRIPAEMPKLTDFITSLSEHLSKEQVSDFLKFHQEALMVDSKMEKSSQFLKNFCFFIPMIALFTAMSVWEGFPIIICILWTILSLIFPIIWMAIHWLLLKITAEHFSVFLKISSIWAFFGVLLYMIVGIAYRKFYLWMVYLYQR